jgi:hypothetical protein
VSLLNPPNIPLFRITLFYGPEVLEGASQTIQCVFNVKKRSWKGGVQVSIELEKSQLEMWDQQFNFSGWLGEALASLPKAERDEYRQKAQDVLTQLICFYKLQEYISSGIQQENVEVGPERLVSETEEALFRGMEDIKRQVLVELDIEAG